MTEKLLAPLRESPAVLPLLGACALLVAWAANEGGYPVTHWAPGGIVLLALLGIATFALGRSRVPMSSPARIAMLSLFAYAAWSYASMIWASSPGSAFEGGDRALLYALIFALFCIWPIAGRAAGGLLCAWVFAMAGLGVYVLLHLNGLSPSGFEAAIPGGRLVYPSGYVNAAAAQWMMAAFPALMLARSMRLHPLLRAALAFSAVLLSSVALLSLSRGSLLATIVLLAAIFVLVPGRLRSFAIAVPVGLGVAIGAPAILRVGERAESGNLHAAGTALSSATPLIFVGAVVAGAIVAAIAWVDGRRTGSPTARRRARSGLVLIASLCAVVLVVGGLIALGNPLKRVEHAWSTFSSSKGYEANSRHTNRLLSGLGSNRYDFYRVAVDQFLASPLLGTGSENFEQQYLRHGRSDETPRYPHSVELRTLAETGLIGAAIAIIGFTAALISVFRVIRSPRGGSRSLSAYVASAALVSFSYWLIHGSADWFWEYPVLGASAFALLGLACGQDRPVANAVSSEPRKARSPSRSGLVRLVALAAFAIATMLAFASPWLSAMETQSAAAIWRADPKQAYAHVQSASELDPWSAEPDLVGGTIALSEGDLARAASMFNAALRRSGQEQYATLELGAIASQRGERSLAMKHLRRALALSPRDAIAKKALEVAASGKRVSVRELNEALYAAASRFH